MIRSAPIDDRPGEHALACDRCGVEYEHAVSGAAALELDGTECFVCEVDPEEVETAILTSRAWSDRN